MKTNIWNFLRKKSFLDSCTDGKSHYWIDVEKTGSYLLCRACIITGASSSCSGRMFRACHELTRGAVPAISIYQNYQHSLTGVALTNLFYPLSVYPRPSLLFMRNLLPHWKTLQRNSPAPCDFIIKYLCYSLPDT